MNFLIFSTKLKYIYSQSTGKTKNKFLRFELSELNIYRPNFQMIFTLRIEFFPIPIY